MSDENVSMRAKTAGEFLMSDGILGILSVIFAILFSFSTVILFIGLAW